MKVPASLAVFCKRGLFLVAMCGILFSTTPIRNWANDHLKLGLQHDGIQSVLAPFSNDEVLLALTKNSVEALHSTKAALLPTVLAPGMGDSCFNPGFSQLTTLVAGRTNQKAVCIGPGDDAVTDPVYSFTKTMDEQVEHFARKVRSNPELAVGFNAIGLSQGNLIIRAYIQRYNDPPVLSFISIHGPHAGVASVPRCDPGRNAVFRELCDLLDYLLGDFVYTPAVQSAVAQSNYFRDPFKIKTYLKGCSFLPEILDQATDLQKSRLVSLRKLVLVMAERDTMIFPKETAVFGFCADRSYDRIVPAADQTWFKTLGLDEMLATGKLAVENTAGDHLRFSITELYNWIDSYFI